jgi:serine/threonine protein kinase
MIAKNEQLSTAWASIQMIREVLEDTADLFADPQRFAKVVIGIVTGMRYTHSIQIAHRDLSADIILFDDEGRIRRFAFGASKRGFALDSQHVGGLQ